MTCTVPRSALPCHSGRLSQITHYLEVKVVTAYGSKDVAVGSTIPVYPCYSTDCGKLHPSAPLHIDTARSEVESVSSAPISTVETARSCDDQWGYVPPGPVSGVGYGVYKGEPACLEVRQGVILY